MTSKLDSEWDQFVKQSQIPPKIMAVLQDFIPQYLQSVKIPKEDATHILKQYFEKVVEQLHHPYIFELFHESLQEPFNYYQLGLDFIRPLVDFNRSNVEGLDQIDRIQMQRSNRENVIFLSNHQIEPDPQVIGLLLEQSHPLLAQQMIFVAGHRVTTDPMAVPLSLGCNLLCIYSKKHINYPPQEKANKVLHNQKTLQEMSHLLKEGGKCIYVAPSGGRDRINAQGQIEVAPFDAANIELFRLIAEQAGPPVHFYPLAIDSYSLLPPPQQVEKEIGERRQVCYAPIRMAVGPELDMENFPGSEGLNKRDKRTKRAEWIWKWVAEAFARLHAL